MQLYGSGDENDSFARWDAGHREPTYVGPSYFAYVI